MASTDRLRRLKRPSPDALLPAVSWHLVAPQTAESVRWVSADGRWIALSLGHEGDMGRVLVADSGGRREWADSYEGALSLARAWRGQRPAN